MRLLYIDIGTLPITKSRRFQVPKDVRRMTFPNAARPLSFADGPGTWGLRPFAGLVAADGVTASLLLRFYVGDRLFVFCLRFFRARHEPIYRFTFLFTNFIGSFCLQFSTFLTLLHCRFPSGSLHNSYTERSHSINLHIPSFSRRWPHNASFPIFRPDSPAGNATHHSLRSTLSSCVSIQLCQRCSRTQFTTSELSSYETQGPFKNFALLIRLAPHTTGDRMAAHRRSDRRRVYLCAGRTVVTAV